MEDGRVHPARIEEVVEKQKVELAKSMKEEGDKVVVELGITQLHTEIVKMLGSLKYRSVHAQNALNHALEVAHISGLLAAEIGVNIKIAKRAGLLHNIGLAAEHTFEGSYSIVGAEIAKKYGESDEVCHAIRAHNDAEKPSSSLAWIVHAANILSNSRPGARRQQMDSFTTTTTATKTCFWSIQPIGPATFPLANNRRRSRCITTMVMGISPTRLLALAST